MENVRCDDDDDIKRNMQCAACDHKPAAAICHFGRLRISQFFPLLLPSSPLRLIFGFGFGFTKWNGIFGVGHSVATTSTTFAKKLKSKCEKMVHKKRNVEGVSRWIPTKAHSRRQRRRRRHSRALGQYAIYYCQNQIRTINSTVFSFASFYSLLSLLYSLIVIESIRSSTRERASYCCTHTGTTERVSKRVRERTYTYRVSGSFNDPKS